MKRSSQCIEASLLVSMNVPVDATTGELRVDPPLSKAGESITFRAHMDLIIGLTACSALQSNNGSFKPIQYAVTD